MEVEARVTKRLRRLEEAVPYSEGATDIDELGSYRLRGPKGERGSKGPRG